MTILQGTMQDGTVLPVQVDSQGRLVAEGLQGPQGPPGEGVSHWLRSGNDISYTAGRVLVGTSSSSNVNIATFQGNSSLSTGTGIVNIALGNTSPGTTDQLGRLQFTDSGHNSAAEIVGQRDGGTWNTSTSRPTRLVFSTTADGASSPTERMRIDSLGRFYLGTTNTDPAFNRVNGFHINSNYQILCRINGSAGWDLGSSSSTPAHIYFFTDNGSARVTAGSISSNGSTTTYNATSDYRLKENVVELAKASERLLRLRPVNFDWKDGFGGTQPKGEGFIAHELQEVCPLAVQGEKDAVDDKGNPKYQGIDQAKLVPLLTAALQEAITKIKTLEAKVAALEGV